MTRAEIILQNAELVAEKWKLLDQSEKDFVLKVCNADAEDVNVKDFNRLHRMAHGHWAGSIISTNE